MAENTAYRDNILQDKVHRNIFTTSRSQSERKDSI